MRDTPASARNAVIGLNDPVTQHTVVVRVVDARADRVCSEVNRIGRARFHGDPSQGMDDPGMVAFRDAPTGVAA